MLAPVIRKIGDVAAQRGGCTVGPSRSGFVTQRAQTSRRHRTLGIAARGEQFPEFRGPRGARKDAADTDDGDGLVFRIARGRRFGLGLYLSIRLVGGVERGSPRFGELFENDVYVQAANAEGIDGGAARQAIRLLGPGRRFRGDVKGSRLPVDLRVERLDIDGRHKRTMLQAEDRLDHARDTRRFQGVTNVGLDARYWNLLAGGEIFAQDFRQRVEFRGIAQIGRGRVRLDVLQRAHVDAMSISALHGLDLSLLTRRPEALAATIGRHSQPQNDRLDGIAVGQGARQGLEDQGDVPLGTDQPVGRGVERSRTRFAHRLGVGEQHQRVALAIRRAADDRHVDPAQLQGANPQHHGLQRRRARGIDGRERAVQRKGLRDRAGHHVDGNIRRIRGALGRLSSNGFDQFADDCFLILRRQLLETGHFAEQLRGIFDAGAIGEIGGQIASLGVADVHTRVAQGQIERIESGVTAGFGRGLAHQQMGIVDAVLQAFWNRAGFAVELAAGNDGADFRVGLTTLATPGIVVQLLVEAIVRQFSDRTAATDQEIPELFQVIRAGEAASHPDNGNRNVGVSEWSFHDLLPLVVSHDHHAHVGAIEILSSRHGAVKRTSSAIRLASHEEETMDWRILTKS